MAAPLDVISALLGISAYQAPKRGIITLDDPIVERIRENMGGNLALQPTTQVEWYLDDLRSAQYEADAGNIEYFARLYRAMRRDATLWGLLTSLTSGVIRLPKKFYGDDEMCDQLIANNGSRSVFDDMCPPSELELLATDGKVLGVGVAELVPVPGRDFPVLVRLEPEFLRYRWVENRWYYNSVAGPIAITPGDGRFVLHTPGGRIAPWLSGLCPSLGRSFINKEHALSHRSNYSAKLANPARLAYAPQAATEAARAGFLKQMIAWGINTVFQLPPGWDAKLLESNGRGYEVFQSEIDTSDKEFAMAISGQLVTTTGGAGFSNADVPAAIRIDIVQNMADQLAYTINAQVLPQWIERKWGRGRIMDGCAVKWDVERPNDIESAARGFAGAAQALDQANAALAPYGMRVNLEEFKSRFNLPIEKVKVSAALPSNNNRAA